MSWLQEHAMDKEDFIKKRSMELFDLVDRPKDDWEYAGLLFSMVMRQIADNEFEIEGLKERVQDLEKGR